MYIEIHRLHLVTFYYIWILRIYSKKSPSKSVHWRNRQFTSDYVKFGDSPRYRTFVYLVYWRGWATTCRPVQQNDTWRDNSWALFAIIGCVRARGRPLVWENEQYSAGVYPLQERRNFDFCHCTGELRWKQHSAPLQRRVVYFVCLDWFSLLSIPRLLFPVRSLSLSFSLSHSLTFLLSPSPLVQYSRGGTRCLLSSLVELELEVYARSSPPGGLGLYISVPILFLCSSILRHTVRFGLLYPSHSVCIYIKFTWPLD